MTVYYTTVAKVKALLQKSSMTTPSDAEIKEFIKRAEKRIERRTMHAWRKVRVTDRYLDCDWLKVRRETRFSRQRMRVDLRNRFIHQFDVDSHTFKVWTGSDYTNFLVDKTQGRDADYWIDYRKGVLYFRGSQPRRWEDALWITFDYGELTSEEREDKIDDGTASGTKGTTTLTVADGSKYTAGDVIQIGEMPSVEHVEVVSIASNDLTLDRKLIYTHATQNTYKYSVPEDIEGCATKMVAIEIVTADDYAMNLPEGSDMLSINNKITRWDEDVKEVIGNRRELVYG